MLCLALQIFLVPICCSVSCTTSSVRTRLVQKKIDRELKTARSYDFSAVTCKGLARPADELAIGMGEWEIVKNNNFRRA